MPDTDPIRTRDSISMTGTLYPSFSRETTSLCPFNDETHLLFERWFSDQRLIVLMGDWEFYPLPYFGQTAREFADRIRKTTWIVCANEQERPVPIGYTGLYLQPRHRVGILRLAIAEPAYWRRGHGYRATQLALQWAFDLLDLVTVHLSLAASNGPALGLYRQCGFRECGRYTESRYEPGGRFDEIHMELMQREWLQLKERI